MFALAFAFQILQAQCKYKVCADAIGQEQPFVTCGPAVRPEREKESCVKEDDRTDYNQNARLMRRYHSLGAVALFEAVQSGPYLWLRAYD